MPECVIVYYKSSAEDDTLLYSSLPLDLLVCEPVTCAFPQFMRSVFQKYVPAFSQPSGGQHEFTQIDKL